MKTRARWIVRFAVVAAGLSGAGCAGEERGGDPPPPPAGTTCSGASAPFSLVAADVVSAVRGPCGRVAYGTSDHSLWLYDPELPAPQKLEDAGADPIFSSSGAVLAYRSRDAVKLYDLHEQRLRATVESSDPEAAMTFVY